MSSTREMIEASYRAAVARAEATEFYVGNAASIAGQYLSLAQGDPTRAVLMLPSTEGAFWARVASHLMAVAAEERDISRPDVVSEPHLEPIEPL